MISLLVSLPFVVLAAPVRAEVIRSLEVTIQTNKDSTASVSERIYYDFEDDSRPGILRNIPVVLPRGGGTYEVDLRLVDATVGNGVPLKAKLIKSGSDVHIALGDQKTVFTGRHIFKLNYDLRRAFSFVDGIPRFYWNVTGTECPVAIEKTSVNLYPPRAVHTADVKQQAFLGVPDGSLTTMEQHQSIGYIEYDCGLLNPGEDFVIVAQFPKGSIKPPTPLLECVFWLTDWWPTLLFPLFTAFGVTSVWWTLGRDAKNLESVPKEWNPPTEITPAGVGTIYDEECDPIDVVATLVDLAERGYLTVRETKKQDMTGFGDAHYVFTKTEATVSDVPLRPFEAKFLDSLFMPGAKIGAEVSIFDLKTRLFESMPRMRNDIYESLTQEGYFQQNPSTIRKDYVGLAIFLGSVGMMLILISANELAYASLGIGIVGSAAIVGCFAFAMPARTAKGVQALRRALGFMHFIATAPPRTIEMLFETDPTVFGRLLPYALVLGVADKWAEKFQGVMEQPPAWYHPFGYPEGDYIFTPQKFVTDLGAALRMMEVMLVSKQNWHEFKPGQKAPDA